MRASTLLVAFAFIVVLSACSLLGPHNEAKVESDYSCGQSGASGQAASGAVQYTLKLGDSSRPNRTLDFCAARSSLGADHAALVFTERAATGTRAGTLVDLTLDSVDTDPVMGLHYSRFEPVENGNVIEAFDVISCRNTRTRLDTLGAAGSFTCSERGVWVADDKQDVEMAGTYSVDLSTASATLPPPPVPTATAPVATESAQPPTPSPAGGRCGGETPGASVGSGSVQFTISGKHTGTGSLPFCPYFSDFSPGQTFLVFTNNIHATEPDGVLLTLGPDENTFQYYAEGFFIDVIHGCDVALSRNDAGGVAGTFSCSASDVGATGSFAVTR